jgi:hypothetical protein
MKKLTIEDAHEAAQQRKGQCLSETYQGAHFYLRWCCEFGHEWQATMANIRNRGTWCPDCSGSKRLTVKDAHRVAADRKGQCLSESYQNIMTHLHWRCEFGHTWSAAMSDVKNKGTWCPECARIRKLLTIEDAHEIARQCGGQCLSAIYVNNCNPLKWRCQIGHEWDASLSNVKNHGSWCPKCSGNVRLTIEDIHEIAKQRRGQCLSQTYENSDAQLRWKCEFGHEWDACLNNVKYNGTWCPICRASHGERTIHDWLIRNKIDFIPQHSFSGSRREYDFYIPSSGWLIEFDGVQHFEDVPFFAQHTSFIERQQADREKTRAAIDNGLCLLRIHHEDADRIPELLRMVTTRMISQVICSRVPEYAYLDIAINTAPKHLTLCVTREST